MSILANLKYSAILKGILKRQCEYDSKVTEKRANVIFQNQLLKHNKTPNVIIGEFKKSYNIDVDIGIMQSFFRNCKIYKGTDADNGSKFVELKYNEKVIMKEFKNQ